VTELFETRIDELGQRLRPDQEDSDLLLSACNLAQYLSDWDARGGVRAMARLFAVAQGIRAKARERSAFTTSAVRCAARLTSLRASGGDGAAIGDYARWVVTLAPSDVTTNFEEVLAPMWVHAGNPIIEHAAEKLFGDPRSPWAALHEEWFLVYLVSTPMMRLRAFRQRVLHELSDHARLGSIEVKAPTLIEYTLEHNGRRVSMAADGNDPHLPPNDTRLVLRVCDHVASMLQGFGTFRIYWPEAVRDEALERMIALLRKR
jgi:hypothetical protein